MLVIVWLHVGQSQRKLVTISNFPYTSIYAPPHNPTAESAKTVLCLFRDQWVGFVVNHQLLAYLLKVVIHMNKAQKMTLCQYYAQLAKANE